ncbi:AEC family transporter [Kosakonia sp. ML.JS2a]|uniref:AEC family transporter n=1 Tax=Kosakonia sp. ML.JS2a TaxID=2980557 RepID=UPI0021D8DCA4|nr:AEC family transporter [Kosakonia sp. ML.JS2a]UXY11206.1 AEC family transporter [Kosakonia sp. ML.JS2a]
MDTAEFFGQLAQQLLLSAPLFLLIALGYGLGRFAGWPESVNEGLNRFCFNVAIPCMLFKVMSKFYQSPPVDMRLLIAYFGSCLVIYVIGRVVAKNLFHLDAISGSVFGLGGIFSNNVMLGIPVAIILLGQASLASVALVLVFNSLILWTLVTVSVEWAQNGSFSARGIGKTLVSVLRNPIIIGIFTGFFWSFALHRPLPQFLDRPVSMVAQVAAPLTLITLGMSLSRYQIRKGLRESSAICLLKLLLMPGLIWAAAYLLHLPRAESQVVVLLGSMAVGVNVYLMAQKFQVLQGATATSMLLSTLLSTVTTPLFMILMGHFYPDWP